LRHPNAETETLFYGRCGCPSTIVDIPPDEISFGDSEALDNDHARKSASMPLGADIVYHI
jgi:hypothetical protein